MLDYSEGKASIRYDTGQFGFRELVLDALATASRAKTGYEVCDLGDVQFIPGIESNVEYYRQAVFTAFRGDDFQRVYRAFGAWLVDNHFGGEALMQKSPIIRIQLPGAESTSYHSDGWYGHGKTVRSFWLPLVDVGVGNSLYVAKNISESEQLMTEIMNLMPGLSKINEMCSAICEPFESGYGGALTFSSSMIHGAERNQGNHARVSFDFRVATNPNDLGTKPRSNYLSRAELDGAGASSSGESTQLSAITYSNRCGGISAQAQLVVCAQFASANEINVNGNESEILPLTYLPVLRHYLADDVSGNNAVIVFSTDIFGGDRDLASSILEVATVHNKTLVFAGQGIVFDPATTSAEKIVALV